MTDTPDIVPDVPTGAPDDELVVHLPHVDLVKAELHDMGVALAGPADPDPNLGLALLTVRDKTLNADDLITTLRERIGGRYGQWVPLMGRNPDITVVGMPQPKSMALDDPRKLDTLAPVPFTSAGRHVRVGVLDTRITNHDAVTGRYVADPDSIYESLPEPTRVRAGHATFVASLVTRMAPAVTVDARWVLDDDGRASAWRTARAMMGFLDSGVDVLNVSLGCRTPDGQPPLVLSRAVSLLSQRMVIVAAAGNHGDPDHFTQMQRAAPTWPAALPDVVAVGARAQVLLGMADVGALARFSPDLPWVTCTAPGENVAGAYPYEMVADKDVIGPKQCTGYATWQGTSFATATVSGAIAARTVPGKVTAREALAQLLQEPDGVVRPHSG